MTESKEALIARLMEEGLHHYGEGRMDQAAGCWREVLRLEPGHPEAEDYLRTAGFDDSEIELSLASGEGDASLLADALELFRKGEVQESLELFETLARENPRRMEIQGYFELVRSHLYKYFHERVADPSRVLKVKIAPEEMMRFNLPANAGFVLSMVDGRTSVNEILALSGMDPFDAVRVVSKLLEAGIVEVSP
jgi:tetratricopeptide (TPR) repeat protein